MALVDPRSLSEAVRLSAADRIRSFSDFALPELEFFNNQPCLNHATIEEGVASIPPCQFCGIKFRKHQRVGIAWLLMRGKGLIADRMGTGKSAQAAGLLACLKEIGELGNGRAVIVVRPSVLHQWQSELQRFVPKLHVVAATGTRKERVETYLTGWEVLLIGFQVFVRDMDMLNNFTISALIVDDIDPLRNPANQTAYSIKRLARRCNWVSVLTGTPLQKRLHELHSVLEPVGGLEVFGSLTAFKRNYVREEFVEVYNTHIGRRVNTRKCVGYKNLDDFKSKVASMTLRRTPADIDDVELPAISPHTVYLDLYPAQAERYEKLRQGVLKIIRSEGATVKHAKAVAQFLYGAQICSGLVNIGDADGPGTSVKLDWVENTIVDGDLSDEKVIVFCQFTKTVEALSKRLNRAGVDHVVIWGRESSKTARGQATSRFWNDPNCRVLIGTTAIEQGLNLQVSRHLIAVDQIMNAARMQQLAGRIQRDGSAYRTVYVHSLLARGTQEEGYLDVLMREQALADHVWDESNQLYDALSPLALLQLVGRSRGTR